MANESSLKRQVAVGLATVVCVTAVVVIAIKGYSVEWTGFGSYSKEADQVHYKTFWDWLDLLVVPLVVALLAWWLKGVAESARQRIESDRQRQATLDSFIEALTELLLDKRLRSSDVDSEVRSIARTRTLSVFRALGRERKGHALQFLKESGLIGRDPIVRLDGANLNNAALRFAELSDVEIRGAFFKSANLRDATIRSADLRGCDFSSADLRRADLTGCDLGMVVLSGANLRGADLTDVRLYGANLESADLRDARVSREQLDAYVSTEGAKLPDLIEPQGKN